MSDVTQREQMVSECGSGAEIGCYDTPDCKHAMWRFKRQDPLVTIRTNARS